MLEYLWPLLVDTIFSWCRMLIALFFSIIIGLGIGIWAATSRKAERIIIPIVDILQTLPILAFFPFVIYIIVAAIPGYIGINAAVIFLIITSMLWNIIFGVYESIKELPHEFIELAALYGMGFWEKFRKIYFPASMLKVMGQSALSWAIGLFYLVTSEIFSTSNQTYEVKHGIGAALASLAGSGNIKEYVLGLSIFVVFVVATRILLFSPLEKHFNRYNLYQSKKPKRKNKIKLNLPKILNIKLKRNTYVLENVPTINVKKSYIKYVYLFIIFAFAAIFLLYKPFIGYEYEVLISLLASFVRVWLAFALILLISIPLSVYLIFFSNRLGIYILLFQVVASIPATVLLPIIVLSLKPFPLHSELVAFTIYFLSGIWYVIFSILSQKAYISKSTIEVKELFGIRGIEAWKKIYIYVILPGIITGAVTGIAAEWNASIVAEYFTSSAIGNGAVITSVGVGIGKLLDTSLDNGNMLLMLLGLLNLTFMIIIVNRLIWKRLYRKVESIYK
jgi:NitT/TauT family transport system permease protein